LAHASGAVVVVAVLRIRDDDSTTLLAIAIALVVAAALAKWDYRRYLGGDTARVTLEAALDVGHSRGTFLTREFGVTPTPRNRAVALWAMAVGAYAIPLAWLASGARSPAMAIGA